MLTPESYFQIPEVLTRFIENRLRDLKVKLEDHSFLAAQVKRLSDFYIANPEAQTPQDSWAEIASLVYFFPLNYLRNLKVFQEAERLSFLQGLENIIEFGAGLGPSSWALQKVRNNRANLLWIENSPWTQTYASLYEKEFGRLPQVSAKSVEPVSPTQTLAVFSYSFTELKDIPAWAEKCEGILILEPSTQEDGRRLQSLRPRLIEKGFSLWGPCLHEAECPLLKHSKKDWCHDRLLLQRPTWLEKIENHLAWENKSLTFSYLLARKTPPPWKNKILAREARVIGDTLFEKGKTRQLVCKDDQRLFFSWLTKEGPAPELPRGSLVHWEKEELKSNEIRPQSEIALISHPCF